MEKYVLWFDVGIKRYTTVLLSIDCILLLWFDVGIKRYTTHWQSLLHSFRCGLM